MRVGLVILALAELYVGAWALPFPRSFYDDFPGLGHHWVSMAGPYDQHLVTDVGGLNLGFAVMFALAAWRADRRTASVVLIGFLLYSVPHLVFHVTHLDHFSGLDATAQTASLALEVILPLALLPLTKKRA